MSNIWTYRDGPIESVEDMPEGVYGFVYVILYDNPYTLEFYRYVGKKNVFHTNNRPLGKKDKILWRQKHPVGAYPKTKKVVKESDWKTYYSSNKVLLDKFKKVGEEYFTREILKFCFSKRELTYQEVKYQFKFEVLENKEFLNDNILGKFYRENE